MNHLRDTITGKQERSLLDHTIDCIYSIFPWFFTERGGCPCRVTLPTQVRGGSVFSGACGTFGTSPSGDGVAAAQPYRVVVA